MDMRLLLSHRSTVQPLAENRVEGCQDVIRAPSGVRMHAVYSGRFSAFRHSLLMSSRIDKAHERTRTAYTCSLRVIHHALQGFAEACRSRIFRRLSVLRIAECCTVLRSR